MRFTTAVISNPGGRELNEDCCSYIETPHFGLWVVADGVGCNYEGKGAAKFAVETVIEAFRIEREISTEALSRYLQKAQTVLHCEQAMEEKGFGSMYSTIVVLAADLEQTIWTHLGDSRLYYFRSGILAFQTKDQSIVQAMASVGENNPDQIGSHNNPKQLLKILGLGGEIYPIIRQNFEPLRPGDAFLLCTDGFWEYLTETEMEVDFAKASRPEEWLQLLERRIQRRVIKEHDNYTAIAVMVG